MASRYIPECDCGEKHAEVMGKLGFVTDLFEANAVWEVCPVFLERLLSILPEDDAVAARIREGIRKVAGQRDRTAKTAAELDVQLRSLTRR